MGDSTDVIATVIAGILIGLPLLFLIAILYTAIGAFIGWVLSLFFLGDWVIDGMKILFGIDISGHLVQVGAVLGFISGFFKGILKKD